MGLSRTDGGVLQVAVSGVFLQTTASEILDGKDGVTGARWGSAAAILVQITARQGLQNNHGNAD